MSAAGQHDKYWVQLTPELLASSDADEWESLAAGFVPIHRAGEEMAEWLRDGIRERSLSADTHAIRTSAELLGFFAVDQVELEFSHQAWSTQELASVELSKRLEHLASEPQHGLMLSAIARTESTSRGFGRVLVEHAIGVTLKSGANVALFVQPANETVAKLWKGTYCFREVDDPTLPGLLYLPVDVPPELDLSDPSI